MPTKLTVGHSPRPTEEGACEEAVRGALRGAAGPSFAFVFSTGDYDPEAIARALGRELPGIPWAGCCAAGLLADGLLLLRGVVVGLLSSTTLRFGVGVAGPVSADGRAAGGLAASRAVQHLAPDPERPNRAVILLPDGLSGNAAEVVRGAAEELGSAAAWAGGGAGDHLGRLRAVQYALGRAYRDHVVAIVVDSPRPLGAGLRHGWLPYGPQTLVTRAAGATIHELEFEPAFGVYRRVAEDHGHAVAERDFARFAMSHPLGIPLAGGEHVIRDPLSVGEEGELRCVAEVPEGSLVRVMHGDAGLLLSAARRAASDAREGVRGPVAGALVFDCVSRSSILGEAMRSEVAAIRDGVGRTCPVLGCLTFGEVGVLGEGVPQFHNKSTVVLAYPAV